MATIKLRDYLLALSSKGSSVDGDIITILDSADGNTIKTVLKSDLVDLDYLVSELQDDFLDQFGEGTFSGSAQVDHDATTNFDANEHIDHTAVSIIAGAGLTGGGDISSDRTINIVSDNNGIVVNADQIELDTDSSTFSGGVLTKMNIEQVVSGSSQISADQTDGWVSDVKTQLNSNTVISGSSQVILNDADKTGFDTDDVVEGTNLYYLDSRVLSKINTEGVISGSTFSSPSQGTLTTTINGVSSNVDLGLQSGDNVTFVDGTFTGNVSINGNLDVLGDAVEIQTSELRIEDKLITVASGSADSAASDGSGLEIDGANKSLKWNHSTQQFVFDAKVSSSVGFKGEGGELTGIDTDQVTEAGNLYYTDARVLSKINTEGVLSGSAQIASDISGSGFVSATNDFEELTLTKGSGETTVVELSPKKVVELVKNKEGHTLPKGTPVYVSGSTGNAANVYAASASREDRMPAAFVLDQQLTTDQEGNGIALGFINGVDTSGFNEGDNVYVGESGGYTNVKPTGNSNRIQKLGNVIKSAVNGSGVITGAGRSNDVPNIQEGYVWVGGTNDVSYQLSTSSLLSGQGVISGSSQIDVTLTTNYSSINQYTDSDNTSHLNSLGVVSGSSQIDVTQTTNYGSINQYTDSDNLSYLNSLGVQSGSDTPHYTDSDNLSYLNSLLVVSKSAGGDLDVNGDITASSFFIDGNTRTTGVHFANGLQHDGDGGTGIYFATDTVEVRTQNNPSLQVDSSGNTNVLFDLDVNGAITASKLFIDDDSNGTGNIVINTYNNLGGSSLTSNASFNTLIGYGNGIDLTDGDYNIAIGHASIRSISDSTSDHNIGIGYFTLNALDTGSNNIAIGESAMSTNQSSKSIGIGRRALSQGTSTGNIAIGHEAGWSVGSTSTLVGYRVAWGLNSTAYGNTALGYQSLGGAATTQYDGGGDLNTAVGSYTLGKLKDGGENTALGHYAGYNNFTDGNRNTLIGRAAGYELSTGNDNIIIGRFAGYSGAGSGAGIISGSGNTLLGTNSQTQNSDDYNSIVIGSGSIGNGSNTVVIGNGDVTSTELKGSITGSSLNIIDTSNPGSDYGSVVIEGRRDGSPNVLTLRAKDNGTPAAALPQDQGAVVRWQGFDGTDFANMGYILVAADGQTVAASDAPSYMAFGVSPDGSETPSEVMRLDSDGVLSLNDSSNDVFLNNNGTAMEIDVNRHPETGVFSDTSKGHARISLIGDTGGSKILFNTANAINTTATTVAEISSGSFSVLDNKIKVGNTSVSANGVTIEKTGNHLFLRATTAAAGEYWNFDVDANNRLNVINDNTVGVYIDDAATSWTGTSDERLKTINHELTGSLQSLQDIRAVNYSWVSGSSDKNFIGLIAQDVEQHYPEMISEDRDGYKGIRYTEMIPVLVSAIKEQQSIIDDLKSRIETLENQ